MAEVIFDEGTDENELDRGGASVSLKNLDEIDYVEHDELLSDEDIEIADSERIEPLSDSKEEIDDDGASLRSVHANTEFNFVCTKCFMTKNNSALSKKAKADSPFCVECE